MKKNVCVCILCKSEIAVCNLKNHYNSKQCNKGGKLVLQPKPSVLNCQYCDKLHSSIYSLRSHELKCQKNTTRIKSDNKRIGKPGGNQFTFAKKMGLPKPIISEETRKKLSLAQFNKPRTYSSKESKLCFQQLISDLNNINVGEIVVEWWLSDGNRNYAYDLCFKDLKILIEYQGTRFHCRNLSDEYAPPFKSMGSKEDVYMKDQVKLNLALKHGYTLLYIWSDSLEKDMLHVQTKILSSCGLMVKAPNS